MFVIIWEGKFLSRGSNRYKRFKVGVSLGRNSRSVVVVREGYGGRGYIRWLYIIYMCI